MQLEAANYDWAKEIPCKNITIYGYCKHEDKCAFKHDTDPVLKTSTSPVMAKVASLKVFTPSNSIAPAPANDGIATRPSTSLTSASIGSNIGLELKKKFSFDSPTFTPSSSTTKFPSPKVASIPTFIPSGGEQTSGLQQQMLKFNIDTPSFSPGQLPSPLPPQQVSQPPQTNPALLHTQSTQDIFYPQQTTALAALVQVLNTTAYPLQYHLYSQPPPPHFQLPLAPYERDLSTLFIDNSLRESLQRKNEASNQVLPHSNLPDHVNQYHSLVPIDNSFEAISRVFQTQTATYKVQSLIDGGLYCLKKIGLPHSLDETLIMKVQRWRHVRSLNVISPIELFTSVAFNDESLFVVSEYFPCSSTLIEKHFLNTSKSEIVTEKLLWGYAVQLTNALGAVHLKNLLVRVWDFSKVIVTNEGRVRLSGCGVMDILDPKEDEEMSELQKEDFIKFGDLMLSLSLSTMPPMLRQEDQSKDALINNLPLNEDFKQFLRYLQSDQANVPDLQKLIAPQVFEALNGLQNNNDFMESQLSAEVENGRLFRLITKLNFIVERPEFLKDESWSETGERYPIKLFRDYVFHQYDEMGKPVLDLQHVLTCLNKLDAGIEERLLLVSSDEKSCLVISYKELKELIGASFRELNK